MKTIIETFEQVGLRDRIQIIIGGGPLTQHYANEIGTDGFVSDAFQRRWCTLRMTCCNFHWM